MNLIGVRFRYSFEGKLVLQVKEGAPDNYQWRDARMVDVSLELLAPLATSVEIATSEITYRYTDC